MIVWVQLPVGVRFFLCCNRKPASTTVDVDANAKVPESRCDQRINLGHNKGSTPFGKNHAVIAQLVERHLAKVNVAGSNPVHCSITIFVRWIHHLIFVKH